MNDEMNSPRPTIPRPRAFQFSLRTVLLVVTVVAILCAVLFGLPDEIGGPVAFLMTLLTPTALLVAAIAGRGNMRAFSAAALVPAAWLALMYCQNLDFLEWYDLPESLPEVWPFVVDNWQQMVDSAGQSKFGLVFVWGAGIFFGAFGVLVFQVVRRFGTK